MPLARRLSGEESEEAKERGLVVREWNFESEVVYSHVNDLLGEGGGPSMMVRMRWIWRSIFDLAAPIFDERVDGEDEEASERRMRASSRNLVVMRRDIDAEFIALKESG